MPVSASEARAYNRRFMQMCSYYLIEPTACTPASGWERGQVKILMMSVLRAPPLTKHGCVIWAQASFPPISATLSSSEARALANLILVLLLRVLASGMVNAAASSMSRILISRRKTDIIKLMFQDQFQDTKRGHWCSRCDLSCFVSKTFGLARLQR